MSAPDPTLSALADAHGVATEYWDWHGRRTPVSAETLRRVLAALDVQPLDESGPAAPDDGARVLPASVVCRQGRADSVPVRLPRRTDGASTAVRVVVELEDGGRCVLDPLEAPTGSGAEEIVFALPADLPLGWHLLRVEVEGAGVGGETTLIVTPARLELPALLAGRRQWGLMTQVYATRSADSWGMGDLADLAALARWGVAQGAGFVLINPLHAAAPVSPIEASPYRPATRRFVSPLYLRPDAISEADALDPVVRKAFDECAARARALNTVDTIDRDAVWVLKEQALRLVYDAPRDPQREQAFQRFCGSEGQGLTDFAVWCVLAETYGLPWSAWPDDLQDPRSATVARFAAEHDDDVRFHAWLQWQLSCQLDEAQQAADPDGAGLGIIHDLAVGVHPDGADTWALRDAMAAGVSVGAPPDQFNQLGQDWQQPPWRPDALAELGYRPYRDMLRTVLREGGGLRVDHVMGLFRLWWVPEGLPPTQGTYVYGDPDAMVGVLALEAQRAGAVVIGEDLGSVEPRVRDDLRERGILGTSILWFELDEAGEPRPPEAYRELCLATVTTHDLPPTAGYLALDHVDVRERLGLLTRNADEERAAEQQVVDRFHRALVDRGLLDAAQTGDAGDDEEAFVAALHAYLAASPARLVGVSVPDLVGDRRAVNQPGTDREYPNWRVPVAGPDGRPMSLEQICASPRAQALVSGLNALLDSE